MKFTTKNLALCAVLTALALAWTDEGFVQSARILLVAHLPVMALEGLISAFALSFLARVRPEVLTLFSDRF